ncbi:hypothetical protein ABVG11_14395 [Streptomyces sp. HD1123-B1]|uniref:hypothetical protein n=1 Tax=Streptomyces huangiella TaxID=3228804 RepID=UPI003D7E7B74
MPASTVTEPTGRTDPTGTPAVALGPTALVLGALSTLGLWVPALFFFAFPWTALAGGLAICLGAMGAHHARRGAGRLWVSAAGAALGATGLGGVVFFLCAYGG